MEATATYEPVARLERDLKQGAATLGRRGAGYLVDLYYWHQEERIRWRAKLARVVKEEEPHDLLSHFAAQEEKLEAQCKGALDVYSMSSPLGRWARSHVGVGPVIAAGLLAHIDVEKASSPSAVWSFAGMNPTAIWERKQKRPWNAALKLVCWKLGQSFVKVSTRDDAFYGLLYAKRWRQEWAANLEGKFAAQALAKAGKAFEGKKPEFATWAWNAGHVNPELARDAVALSGQERMAALDKIARAAAKDRWQTEGRWPMLAPAHVNARAARIPVKLFLSHFWEVGRRLEGLDTRSPYAQGEMGHGDYIPPPNLDAAGLA